MPANSRWDLIRRLRVNIILPSTSWSPQWLFASGFPTNTLCTPLSSPISATCPAHLIRLDFTTRTILGKEYRSFSSSLCSFLHSPVTSSLLGPNTFLNTLFSNTLSLRSLPQCQRPGFIPIQNHGISYIISSYHISYHISYHYIIYHTIYHHISYHISYHIVSYIIFSYTFRVLSV